MDNNFDNLVDQAYQDREPIKDRGNNSNLKRIEEIEKEWPGLLERLQMNPKKKLLHLNSSGKDGAHNSLLHWTKSQGYVLKFSDEGTINLDNNPQAAKPIKTSKSYRDWYTSESKDIIKIAFQEDLDLFGYKF